MKAKRFWQGVLVFALGCQVLLNANKAMSQTGITVPEGYEVEVFVAAFSSPMGMVFDANGDLLVADNVSGRIYSVSPAGDVSVLAVTPYPDPLALDAAGNLYVGNSGSGGLSHREPGTVTRITPAGDMSVFSYIVDADGLTFGADGNLFVSAGRYHDAVIELAPNGDIVRIISTLPYNANPDDLAIDGQGNLFVGAGSVASLIKINLTSEVVTPVTSDLIIPHALLFDSDGTLYVSDASTGNIHTLSSGGEWSVFATGFLWPAGMVFDTDGALYVSERGGLYPHPIYKITRPTPADLAEDVINDIMVLMDSGVLDLTQDAPLLTILDLAIARLEGMPSQAANMLETFIALVESRMANGRLTPEEGQNLIDAACVVLDAIGHPCTPVPPLSSNSIASLEQIQHRNYPNPFNPTTMITFSLPAASQVELEIFNILGQSVTTLFEGHLSAGMHSYMWDGSSAASGVYLYRLTAGDYVESRQMTLLK